MIYLYNIYIILNSPMKSKYVIHSYFIVYFIPVIDFETSLNYPYNVDFN